MEKNNSDIKKYGVDLEKDYNDTKLKLANLEAKILKRAKLLKKQQPDMIVLGIKTANRGSMENRSINYLLTFIKEIERIYVNRSKQLDAFEDDKD